MRRNLEVARCFRPDSPAATSVGGFLDLTDGRDGGGRAGSAAVGVDNGNGIASPLSHWLVNLHVGETALLEVVCRGGQGKGRSGLKLVLERGCFGRTSR